MSNDRYTPGTAVEIKNYRRGFRSGLTPSYEKITRADGRREAGAWYMGYFAAEAGEADASR